MITPNQEWVVSVIIALGIMATIGGVIWGMMKSFLFFWIIFWSAMSMFFCLLVWSSANSIREMLFHNPTPPPEVQVIINTLPENPQ